MNPELERRIIKRADCAGKGQSHKRLRWVFWFCTQHPPTHRSTSTSLVKLTQLVTYQSSENNRVGDGMQGGVVDLSAKSRREREIDSEPADGDKSKTKPVCVCVCVAFHTSISTFKEQVSAGTCFFVSD